jgi:hypothetical protein
MTLLKEIHVSESFTLVLYVLVTSMKLHECQAKVYFSGVKCFQARHIIIFSSITNKMQHYTIYLFL